MSIVKHSIQGITGLVVYAFRVFVLSFLVIEIGLGLGLAAACFWIAADGSTLRGVISAIVAIVAATILGLILAGHRAILLMIGRAVRQAALGRTIFDALFNNLLGVSIDKPGGDSSVSQLLHGLSPADFGERLNRAAEQLLGGENEEFSLRGIPLRIARRFQRAAVWITVKIILAQCEQGIGEDGCINLPQLQSYLADRIDSLVLDYVRGHLKRLSLVTVGIVIIVSIIAAATIRQFPI